MTNTNSQAKTQSLRQTGRPLSPHIGIYRWQLTMTMSILHRISGCALAVALFALTWMLAALAGGEASWQHFVDVAASPVGRLALFGWAAAFYYHLFNGLRHLMWDTGRGFDIRNAYRSGYLVWVATLLCLAGSVWLVMAH